ncbi:MAG: hypothetical protein HKM04_02745 [Legionellales bacterium]|nr:hypothetical protein [Legionellales bacterium]
MKQLRILSGLFLLAFPFLTATAGTLSSTPSATYITDGSLVPDAGLFVGLGGSYNSVYLNQSIEASGVSSIFIDSILAGNGEAGGTASPFKDTDSTFAPQAQIGYFRHFSDTDYLWGFKYFYQYLGTTISNDSFSVPQSGAYTSFISADTFTGNVVITSAQTSINHEMALMPFIGRSFKKSYVYLGVGPALFETETNIYGANGYADLNGIHTDITGSPTNFSDSNWVWGGAAQIGLDYYLNPTWFVDFNYTYARSADFDNHFESAFSSSTAALSDTGTLYVNPSQHVTTQTFAITINKVFT